MSNLLKDLEQLISIESVCNRTNSPDEPFGQGCKRVLEEALSICSRYGLRTKNCNNMIGYAEAGQGEELMGILVHLDVVPAGEGWKTDPFALHIENGRIYGRGVTDDKGPAVAVIHAVKELIDEGRVFNRRVRIIFGLAEESGSWDDMEYYRETEEPVDFGFTPDADFPAICGEKGMAKITFTFEKAKTCFKSINGGTAVNMVPSQCYAEYYDNDSKLKSICVKGKSAHGSTPEDGKNAISLLMKSIAVNDCCLTGFFRDCIDMEYNGRKLGGYACDVESGEITYNFGLVRDAGSNIVLTTDVRYPVSYRIEDILMGICDKLQEKGYGDVDVELISDVPCIFVDAEGPVITKLLDAYRQHTGDMSRPSVIGGGTYARAMKNVVAFGPMLPGRELTEHQANENMLMSDFLLAKDIYKTAIRTLAT